MEIKRLIEEFPHIPRDSTFKGVVDTTFMSTLVYRASLYIVLKDGEKFSTSATSMPKDVFGRWEIPSYALIDFLQKGDTIYKPKDKDSLYVLKYNLRFGYHLITKEFSDSVHNMRW
ncbi:hypothetical protein IR148_15925 [Dysgonomonas mossii]|uniref:Uncharacterized protein n=1 Tax=Dysgonomonas mossii TaxID=163665 RepID=A0A4Y9IK10_9BACT|nr:hypothetical protein [Dysgonomonas mossii]MBF0762529.1 hypothetical protein [Dysgonomonas mossii]TFU86934.1 hypothetical protein E4T88_15900 [Dysgonomonas mossii]